MATALPDDATLDDEDPAEPEPATPARRGRTRLRDDLDSVEIADEGGGVELDAAPIAAFLSDPDAEEPDREDEADAEAPPAARPGASTLATLAKSPDLRDAYDDWARETQRGAPPLTDAEISRLLDLVHSANPDDVAFAEDRLVRTNVKWILRCLQREVGADKLRHPGDFRNDLLSEARMGFLEAIRKYDKTAARTGGAAGKPGKTKTLLGYGQIWISKRVREFLSVERFGLNQDAALDRNRVLRAKAALQTRLQRPPTLEDITRELERLARAKLRDKGIPTPNARQLWRSGALNIERVKELDAHVPTRLSLDAPTGDDESDAPSVASYIAAPDLAADRGLEDDDQIAQVDGAVRRHPSRTKRMAVRMAVGLRTESPPSRFQPYNFDEIGLFLGRSREAVSGVQDEFRAAVQGEVLVPVDQLYVPGVALTLPDLRALTAIPVETRRTLVAAVPLWELAGADGVRVSPRALGSLTACPLCRAETPTLQIGTQRFTCTACARAGDAIDWIMAARGASLGEAAAELGRALLRLPAAALREAGRQVLVTKDPARRRRLRHI